MTVVYVLAHFDDEVCAWPLIRRDLAEDRRLRFIHLADDPDSGRSARRRGESLAFLAGLGVSPKAHLHLGAGRGWIDGALHLCADNILPALLDAVAGAERLGTPAWEGGHPDHDICAALTSLAGVALGCPVDQVPLYQGKAMPGIVYQACRPLP